MSSDLDLCYLTATEAIDAFKARRLSPVDVMKAMIARCEAVNDKINAVTCTFFDRALKQARQAESRYGKTDGRVRPLEGIATAIEDFHPVEGEVTTFGSKAFRDFRPGHSAPTVERLLDAGAIMHCRSTTPEFACSGVTQSPLWGATANPWNLDYTPGGSSGGAGALLAAGMTTIADGTDGGGSIRIPASACGVFGYKPPFGRNPTDREHPLQMLLSCGPMTRSVADAALMQNVMSGAHPGDMCSLRETVQLPQAFADIKGWKIAFSMDLGYFAVDPEVRRNTLAAVEVFKSLGCIVDEVELDWNWGALDAWMTQWEGLFAGTCGDLLPRWRYEMDDFVVTLLERGMSHGARRLHRSNSVCGEMYRKLAPILDCYDILVCPTLSVPSVRIDHNESDPDFRVDGQKVPAFAGWIMTNPFSLMAQCPVASVPSGFASSGVPTGMQIVAKTFDDLSVFQAAAAFERARPWATARPDL
jgi:amidase